MIEIIQEERMNMYWSEVKEWIVYGMLFILFIALCIGLYLGVTWVEIQIARWMGVDPVWVVGGRHVI